LADSTKIEDDNNNKIYSGLKVKCNKTRAAYTLDRYSIAGIEKCQE